MKLSCNFPKMKFKKKCRFLQQCWHLLQFDRETFSCWVLHGNREILQCVQGFWLFLFPQHICRLIILSLVRVQAIFKILNIYTQCYTQGHLFYCVFNQRMHNPSRGTLNTQIWKIIKYSPQNYLVLVTNCETKPGISW